MCTRERARGGRLHICKAISARKACGSPVCALRAALYAREGVKAALRPRMHPPLPNGVEKMSVALSLLRSGLQREPQESFQRQMATRVERLRTQKERLVRLARLGRLGPLDQLRPLRSALDDRLTQPLAHLGMVGSILSRHYLE